jgi:hypothetical protein
MPHLMSRELDVLVEEAPELLVPSAVSGRHQPLIHHIICARIHVVRLLVNELVFSLEEGSGRREAG